MLNYLVGSLSTEAEIFPYFISPISLGEGEGKYRRISASVLRI